MQEFEHGEGYYLFPHVWMLCRWCAEHTQLISNTHHAPTPSTDYLQASPKARERAREDMWSETATTDTSDRRLSFYGRPGTPTHHSHRP